MSELVECIKRKFQIDGNVSIVVSGIIGIGKTTLCKQIVRENSEISLVEEKFDENPYLEDFYKNKKEFATKTQFHFLSERFDQAKKTEILMKGKDVIFDRHFIEDYAFALCNFNEGNINETDFLMYTKLYNNILDCVAKPTIVLYLRAAPEICHARICSRNRSIESDIPLDYLLHLNDAYETFFEEYSKTNKVITLDWNDFSNRNLVEKIEEF